MERCLKAQGFLDFFEQALSLMICTEQCIVSENKSMQYECGTFCCFHLQRSDRVHRIKMQNNYGNEVEGCRKPPGRIELLVVHFYLEIIDVTASAPVLLKHLRHRPSRCQCHGFASRVLLVQQDTYSTRIAITCCILYNCTVINTRMRPSTNCITQDQFYSIVKCLVSLHALCSEVRFRIIPERSRSARVLRLATRFIINAKLHDIQRAAWRLG